MDITGKGASHRPQTPESLSGFFLLAIDWLRRNARAAFISALIGAAFGYITNVFLLAVVYGGSHVVPGTLAFGQGNFFWGSLGFGLGGTVVGGLVGYWRTVGTQRFFSDLAHFPTALAQIFKRDGREARVHLLWGAAVSLVAATLISPWVGLFLAAGLMSSLPSILGRLISATVLRLWSELAHHAEPSAARKPAGITAVTVGILGGALALCGGFFLPGSASKLYFAAACALAALMLSRRIPPSAASLLMMLQLARLALGNSDLGLIGEAFASCKPGECVPGEMKPWGGTSTSPQPGASDLPAALLAGGSAIWSAIGALIGSGVGGTLGALSGAGGSDIGLEPEAEAPQKEPGLEPQNGAAQKLTVPESKSAAFPESGGATLLQPDSLPGGALLQPDSLLDGMLLQPDSLPGGALLQPDSLPGGALLQPDSLLGGALLQPDSLLGGTLLQPDSLPGSERAKDAPLTVSAVPDDQGDLPEPDLSLLQSDTAGDLPVTPLQESPIEEPVNVDDFPELPGNAPGSQSAPPDSSGNAAGPATPTPEGTESLNQEKRDKLHDIIKTLAGMEDPDKRNQLIGIVRSAAQVDEKGVPQGDLNRIATMVHDQLHPDQPPGMIEEALQQTKDFAQGVGEDLGEIGKAAANAAKPALDAAKGAVDDAFDTALDAAQKIHDLATDQKARNDFWHRTEETLTNKIQDIDNSIKTAAQFGKDFVRDVKDLATDQEFSNDFWDSANQNLDKATDKIGTLVKKAGGINDAVWDSAVQALDKTTDKIGTLAKETAQAGKDIWNNPSLIVDTLSGTLEDLQDPKKVEEAFRNGVSGGERIMKATDKGMPVLERLKNALLGASEWAGAADNVANTTEIIGQGAKALGNLGSGLLNKAAGLGENLAGKAAINEAESLAGKTALKEVESLADDAARGAAKAGGEAMDAAEAIGKSSKGVATEVEQHVDDTLKAGDDIAKMRKPGMPESAIPPPQGVVERGTHVRNILREEGYRDDLISRVGYEPMHASGDPNVLGSTRGVGQDAESMLHSGAFDEGPTSLRSTTQHEVDHMLQKGQLETQAAALGPKADWLDEKGKWTPKGREMAEMEVRMQELDRNLLERESAIRRAGGNPTDRTTWPQEALDADKEASGARNWLEGHGVGKKSTSATPVLEPSGEDLYKVEPSPPAVKSMQKIPGFESEEAAKQWVKDHKKTWADTPNITGQTNDVADVLAGMSDKPGIEKLAKDLVSTSESTAAGASGAVNWANQNKHLIKSIEVASVEGRRGADFVLEHDGAEFLLEHTDALSNTALEVAEVKTYNWRNGYYLDYRNQAEVAEKIVDQLAARAASPEYASHGLRLVINDMDRMPPRLRELITGKLTERGLAGRVNVGGFTHFGKLLDEPL